MARITMMLLFTLGIGLVQNSSALPFSDVGSYECPAVTAKCGVVTAFRVCRSDGECPNVPVSSNPQRCCKVACEKEKYCVRSIRIGTPTKPVTTEPVPTKLGCHPTCQSSGKKNVVILVDGTAHGNQGLDQVAEEFQKVKDFVKDVVRGLGCAKSRVSVIQFGGRKDSKEEFRVSDSSQPGDVGNYVDAIEQVRGSGRRTGEALAAASNKLYEMQMIYDYTKGLLPPPGVVLLVTRGKARDVKQAREELLVMNLKKVKVVSVAVGPRSADLKSYLQGLSCAVDVYSGSYSELGQKLNDVLGDVCSAAEANCIPEIAAGLSCRNRKYDIYFLIDGSASINYVNFDKKKKLIMDLLVFLKSAPSSNINVGVMQFSETNKTEELLPLGGYSLSDAQAPVEQMEFQAGRRTMLGNALVRVSKVFVGSGGDRREAENKLIIFSDGTAHDHSAAMEQAEILKRRGVEVITISVKGHSTALKEMASDPKLFLNMKLDSLADSSEYADKIQSLICRSE